MLGPFSPVHANGASLAPSVSELPASPLFGPLLTSKLTSTPSVGSMPPRVAVTACSVKPGELEISGATEITRVSRPIWLSAETALTSNPGRAPLK